jgi:hypothetical protein
LNSAASDSKADSLYSEGHYFEASIEYERQIFYAKTNDHQNYFQFQKGLCYKQLKDFSKATDVFQTIYFTNFNDTLYQQVCYQQSLCYYLQGEPSKALWKIDEYFHHCSDSSSYQVFMPIRLFSLNDTRQWHEAQKCFAQYVKMQAFSSEKELEVLEIVNSFYSKNNLPKIKSIEAAENWSRFIPGAGQIYSGETLEGFVNLLINSSILAFAGYQLYYHYYITGYLVGLGFFNKTYHGGMKRASILTSLENKKALIIFNNKINYFLQYNFYKKNLNKVN